MRTIPFVLAVFVFLRASPLKAEKVSTAAVLCVEQSGSGSCFTSIQQALNAAKAGDTINVAAGTYKETLALKPGVKLIGAGAATTIISGNNSGPVIRAEDPAIGQTTVVENFTIRDGLATGDCVTKSCKGAGIYIANAAPAIRNNIITNNTATNAAGIYVGGNVSPLIENNEVSYNNASSNGGGALVESSNKAIIRSNTFHHNTAGNQGGALIVATSSTPQVYNNTFRDNTAAEGGGVSATLSGAWTFSANEVRNNIANGSIGAAGGMFIFKSAVTLRNNIFDGNRATVDGGGAIIDNSDPNVITIGTNTFVEGNIFTGNLAGRNAGALFVVNGASPTVRGNTFRNNNAVGEGGALNYFNSAGGVIENSTIDQNTATNAAAVMIEAGSTPLIQNNQITNNHASNHAGGLLLQSSSPTITGNTITGNIADSWVGGIWVIYDSKPLIQRNTIKNNSGSEIGGGLAFLATSGSTVVQNQIINNQAATGAGLYINGSSPLIERNWIEGNSATQFGGGIFMFSASSQTTVVNNVIVDNQAQATDGGAGISLYRSQPTLASNTIVDNTGSEGIYTWVNSGETPTTSIVRNNIIVGQSVGLKARGGASLESSYNLVWGNARNYDGVSPASTDVSLDPLFTNRSGHDFTLVAGSPAIDVADAVSSPAVDFSGTARPIDGDGRNGAQPDMGVYEAPQPATALTYDTYIALGQTSSNATTPRINDLVLFNSGATTANVTVRFVKEDGSTTTDAMRMIGPNQTVRVRVNNINGMADANYSTIVQSSTPEVVAELNVHWKGYSNIPANSTGGMGSGSYAMRATANVYELQYFASGYFDESHDNRLVVFNPSPSQTANVYVRFTPGTGAVQRKIFPLGPGARKTLVMDEEFPALTGIDYSTRVESVGVPVVAEMEYIYTKRNATGNGTGGYAIRGAPSGYTRQFFALGYNKNDATDPTKEQWVNFLALYNYSNASATVTITYTKQLQGRPAGVVVQNVTIAPAYRYSFKVATVPGLQDVDYSTVVQSSQPIMAEMAYLYDQYNTYIQKSDGYMLRGAEAGALTQVLATGNTGPAGSLDEFEWVNYMALVNPNPTDVTATITHYDESGNLLLSYSKFVPANGRLSYRVDLEPTDRLPMKQMENKLYSTRIVSSQPIVAELALCFKNFGAGPLLGVGGGYALRAMPQ